MYTDKKPITLILYHFHDDHIADAAAFDGVTLIDRPDIRAEIKDGIYTIGPLESHGMNWRPLKVARLVADGEVLSLGGRTFDVFNIPGYTTESVVLFDRERNQVFTGDFVYRHLGGIIVFASGSDLTAYKENSTRLLQITNADTQFFGAHGIPRFDRDWLTLLDRELSKSIKGAATYRYTLAGLSEWGPVHLYDAVGRSSDLLVKMDGAVDCNDESRVTSRIRYVPYIDGSRVSPWFSSCVRLEFSNSWGFSSESEILGLPVCVRRCPQRSVCPWRLARPSLISCCDCVVMEALR